MTISDAAAAYRRKIYEVGFSNPVISKIRKTPDELCVIDGYWGLEKALNAGVKLRALVFCPEMLESDEALALLKRALGECADKKAEACTASAKTFEKISDRDEPCGIIALADLPRSEPASIASARLLVVLDGLQTPGNVGTILRTADGAGAGGVIIVNRHTRLNSPRLIKGSMGAIFSVPIVEFASVSECRSWLSERGFSVWLADTRAAADYRTTKYSFPAALVCGCERYGISREWYDGSENLVKIPMRGVSDSLNVGVAASVFIYEMAARLYT